MSKTLSPAQAAKRSGVSRWTIMRAIKASEIKALRDNHNHWRINEKSFDDWCKERSAHTDDAQPFAHAAAQPDAQADMAKSVRIAELEVETKMMRHQIDELKQDRDAWKQQAERLSEPRLGFFGQLLQKLK